MEHLHIQGSPTATRPGINIQQEGTGPALRIRHDGSSGNALEVLGANGAVAWAVDRVGSSSAPGLTPTGVEDAATIAAAAPDVSLRAGTYIAASGAVLASQSIITGRGMGYVDIGISSPTSTAGLSSLQCPSATADGLAVQGRASKVADLDLVNTAGSTPSAGAGLHVSGKGTHVRDVSSRGFYNGAYLDAVNGHVVTGLSVYDPVNYGLYVGGADIGDGVVDDTFLISGPTRNGATALRWEGGGGMKVSNLKVNATNNKPWTNGVDLHALAGVVTSELLFSNSVIDNYTGTGVNVAVDATGGLSRLLFNGVQVRGSLNPTNGYVLRGNGLSDVSIVGGSCILGTNGLSCLDINNIQRLTIDGIELGGVPVANPIVLLGNSVTQAKVNLGVLRGPNGSGAWTTGTNQYIYENLSNGTTTGQGAASELQCSFQGPAITSNSVYSALWKMVGFGFYVEFTLWALGIAGATSTHVVARQQRLVKTEAGVASFTTVGTDAATSTDIDIQWLNLGGSSMQIGAKINPGSTATSLGANLMSQVRVVGGLQQLYAYA